jgi:hypothetical protein
MSGTKKFKSDLPEKDTMSYNDHLKKAKKKNRLGIDYSVYKKCENPTLRKNNLSKYDS